MLRALISAALLAAAAVPAVAQDAPATAGEAAGKAVHDVCLGMFDGQPADATRLGTIARAAGFQDAMGEWVTPSPAGTTVSVQWVAANNICQVTVTGPAGSGDDLLSAMDGIGWTSAQRGVQSSPDMTVDVWTGQPQGVSTPLFVVANKWTGSEEPEGGKRLVLVVVRAN